MTSAGGLPSLAGAGVEDVDGRVDVVIAVVRHGLQTEAGRVGGDRGLFDEMRDETWLCGFVAASVISALWPQRR